MAAGNFISGRRENELNAHQFEITATLNNESAVADAAAHLGMALAKAGELVAEAEGNATGASFEPSGRLRVQCMASFGGRYILPLIARYCARYPRVTIDYSTSQYFP